MATAEHTYRYLVPSTVLEEEGRAEVNLATSGVVRPTPATGRRITNEQARATLERLAGARSG